jgi:hypothetical protein
VNTTGSNELQVLFKVDGLPNLTDWDVAVFAFENLPVSEHYVWQKLAGVLDTNGQGQGNVMVKLDISTALPSPYHRDPPTSGPFEADAIWVLHSIAPIIMSPYSPASYAGAVLVQLK